MSRRQKDPLRALTDEERHELTRLARSQVAPAAEVIRARILRAVAAGGDYPGGGRSGRALPAARPLGGRPLRRRRLAPRRPLQRRGPGGAGAPPWRRAPD